jgi:flagellar biosynthesis protein FlhF
MRLKTFVAQNLKEALSQVKRDLGPEAVILSTQGCRLPDGKSGGGPRAGVEVTAAVDLPSQQDAAADGLWAGKFSPASESSLKRIQEELKELKGIFHHWLRQNGPPAWLSQHGELVSLFRALTRAGVAETVLSLWLAKMQAVLSRPNREAVSLKEEALRCLMSAFPVVDPWEARKIERRIWTFLGPTGVGKTTTLAKLAVQFSLIKKRQVGLISLDSQRLGAVEQLAAFTRIAGLPLHMAHCRTDMETALHNMAGLDLILIDSPGRSPHYPALHMELRQLFDGLPDVQHHLVLSAAAKESHLADAIRSFSVVPLSSIIVTKLDESRTYAQTFNLICQNRLPLSYLTTGQRVPEDLELATPRRVTELVLWPHPQSPHQGT